MGPAAQHLFSVQPYKVWGVIRCGGRAPKEAGGVLEAGPFPGSNAFHIFSSLHPKSTRNCTNEISTSSNDANCKCY